MNAKWTLLGLGLLAQPALALDIYRFPKCADRPVVSVPNELRGTFFAPADRKYPEGRLVSVGAEGIESHHIRLNAPLDTDAQIQQSGFCRYSEIATAPNGKMYVITTLHGEFKEPLEYRRENMDFRFSYDPVLDRHAESVRGNVLALLLWFIPAGTAAGWTPELELLKIADSVPSAKESL